MLAKLRKPLRHNMPTIAVQSLAVVLVILLSGCRPFELDDSLFAPAQTTAPQATPTITPTPLVTGGGVARPHYFVVSYANQIEAEGLKNDQKRISVVATIGTTADQAMTIGADSIVLVDQDGVAYAANPPEEAAQPALPGYELGGGENIYGFVTFDIPATATPIRLLWCAEAAYPCDIPFESEIP